MNNYDLVVIGSGPGGYVAAIRAAQLGFTTALIEKYPTLGGTCLNVGCIPSKALLDSSEHYYNAQKKFAAHGILAESISLDFSQMISRKNQVISQTSQGVKYLMDKNKITVYNAIGAFKSKNILSLQTPEGASEEIAFKNAIIATGSKPAELPFLKIDKKRVISSTQALSLSEVPERLIIIGAGVIGLELGSIYNRLGAEVRVIEFLDRITPALDTSLAKELEKTLKKSGIFFHLSTSVTAAQVNEREVKISARAKSGEELSLTADYVLMAVGRKPYTTGLGLENLGIKTDGKGCIAVNEKLRSACENVYAIGDVIGGAMLAHKASEEGVFVAEQLAGQKPHINYDLIPSVVYTWPEAAAVGKTEEQLKADGISYKSGEFPMRALGRARASGDLEGFVKILADKSTDKILGVHILGARAADIIMEAVTAMEFEAAAEDIARISHPHPTFTEALHEAALAAAESRPLHV